MFLPSVQSIELGTIKRTIKGADGKCKVVTEYQEHEVHDTVVSALLKQAYGMYRVAHGTMDSLVNAHEGNTRPLQRSLEEFFESWVLGWNFEKTMTLERALDGINYLPLTRPSYLAVDRLVKNVRDKYPFITHSMVTFEDQLVSTDIRDSDQRAVWKQIVQLTGYDGASANAAAGDRREEEEARKKKVTALDPKIRQKKTLNELRLISLNGYSQHSDLANRGPTPAYSGSTDRPQPRRRLQHPHFARHPE